MNNQINDNLSGQQESYLSASGTNQEKPVHQVLWFLLVGCIAALFHWIIASSLLTFHIASPLIANSIAWICSFWLSFTGHYNLTFKHRRANIVKSMIKFFLVSLSSFIGNQVLFYLGLCYISLDPRIILFFVLIIVAVFSFVISKIWAFKNNG